MSPGFKELLSTFNAHGVRYLIDLFIRPDAGNAQAVYAALSAFGAPLEGLTPDDFLDNDGFFRMGRPPVMIEILPSIKGVEFDHARERRIETVIDVDTGLSVFMISREDLIASKLAAARPQARGCGRDPERRRKLPASDCAKADGIMTPCG
jgi:hypothetical protein